MGLIKLGLLGSRFQQSIERQLSPVSSCTVPTMGASPELLQVRAYGQSCCMRSLEWKIKGKKGLRCYKNEQKVARAVKHHGNILRATFHVQLPVFVIPFVYCHLLGNWGNRGGRGEGQAVIGEGSSPPYLSLARLSNSRHQSPVPSVISL